MGGRAGNSTRAGAGRSRGRLGAASSGGSARRQVVPRRQTQRGGTVRRTRARLGA